MKPDQYFELVLVQENPDGSALYDILMDEQTEQIFLEQAQKKFLTLEDYVGILLKQAAIENAIHNVE